MTHDDNDTAVLKQDETAELISSEKGEGTAVYNRDTDKIGTIHHLMVGKSDGRVRYAVIGGGGFLGMGEDYYAVPWDILIYGIDRDGYMLDIDKDRLKDAPRFALDREPVYDTNYDRQLTGYYASARA